jgi:hypothetical protein
MAHREQKIKDGTVRASCRPTRNSWRRDRGSTQQAAGSMQLGSAPRGRTHAAAEQVELRREAPMAVALTRRRLIALKIGTPIGRGIGGEVMQLMGAVALDEVDSIVAKRLALGYTITRRRARARGQRRVGREGVRRGV